MARERVLGDGEAEAGAAGLARAAAVDAVEALGEARDVLVLDADAGVLDAEARAFVGFAPGERDRAARRGVADRVAHQVAERARELALDPQEVGAFFELQLDGVTTGGERLGVLSAERAVSALPFGGKYRVIDFALSNCCHSGIEHVGVLAQHAPASLNDHIGAGRPWDLDRRQRGVVILQPYQTRSHAGWYRGTADAITQNWNILQDVRPGGHLHFCHHLGDHPEVWVRGIYHEVAVPTLLSFSVGFADPQGNPRPRPGFGEHSLITVRFRDLGERTEVIVRHSGLRTDQGEGNGWRQSLERLGTLLSTRNH